MPVCAFQQITLDQLAGITGGHWTCLPQAPLKGCHFDTRELRPGDLFVALSCGVRDGHQFAEQAVANGAQALLVERALPLAVPQLVVVDTLQALGALAVACRQAFTAPVTAITGSSGKTSTKEMLRGLLGETSVHATRGNWNNRIGVPMTLFDLVPGQQDFAVVEAGINQPGEMALLGEMIQADLVLLTNIGTAHLELLGSQAGIAQEKIKLAAHARADTPLILPAEALQYPSIRALSGRAMVLLPDGQPRPEGVREAVAFRIEPGPDPATLDLLLEGPPDTWSRFSLATRSRGMAQNAALALMAARHLGVAESLLGARLAAWRPGHSRGRWIEFGKWLVYSDCYNANPDSLCDAMEAFEASAPPELPRCYVLGAMNELGSASAEFHRRCGRRLRLRPEDRAVLIGPPEMTAAYLAGAVKAGARKGQFCEADSVTSAGNPLADFEGALFLKGSRGYTLEKILPPDFPA